VIATASRQPQKRSWCIHQRLRERFRMNVCPSRCVAIVAPRMPALENAPIRAYELERALEEPSRRGLGQPDA
jgi:hypothetical protein